MILLFILLNHVTKHRVVLYRQREIARHKPNKIEKKKNLIADQNGNDRYKMESTNNGRYGGLPTMKIPIMG